MESRLSTDLRKLYSQICYGESYHRQPVDCNEIIQHVCNHNNPNVLWFNTFITVNGETVLCKDWYERVWALCMTY